MPSIKCIYDKDYVLYQSKGKTLIQRPCECFVIHVYAASGPLHYNIHTHTQRFVISFCAKTWTISLNQSTMQVFVVLPQSASEATRIVIKYQPCIQLLTGQ